MCHFTAGCLQKHPIIAQTALSAAVVPREGKRGEARCTAAVAKKQKSMSIALGNGSGDGEMLSLPSFCF